MAAWDLSIEGDHSYRAQGFLNHNCEVPNLQNIPKRTERGRRIRTGFVARPGYKLISVDYSQIEMVVLAHESQDPNLLRVFREGLDMHTLAASLVFDTPYEAVTSEQRQSAKHLNFGLVYGITAMGFKAQMDLRGIDVTIEWCEGIIERYFREFAPGVQAYMKRVHLEAKRTGVVRDLWGRIRRVPGARSSLDWIQSAALREAGNFPIQSGAQGIIKRAMGDVWRTTLPTLWSSGVDIEPLVQVHDELLFECEESEADDATLLIAATMQAAAKLSVPISVGSVVGGNWGELK